jgi:hypothetical protein
MNCAPTRDSAGAIPTDGNEKISHAFLVRATAFWYDPIDNLVGIGDVAGFAVDTAGGVDF